MNNKTLVSVGVVILLVIASIYVFSQDNSDKVAETQDTKTANDNVPLVSGTAGVYTEYSLEKLALVEGKDILLFFHASWCEECHELNKNINEHLNEIPENVTILKVDYDNSTELKKKYGVTRQYTLVQVDIEGDMINKFSGSSTLAKVLTKIQ
jgi:thioredoxin-like negative regulator of GroEL